MPGPAQLQGNDDVGESCLSSGKTWVNALPLNSTLFLQDRNPRNFEIHRQEVMLYNQGWRPEKCW